MSIFDKLNKRTEQEFNNLKPTEKANVQDIVSEISTILGYGIAPKKKISDFLGAATGWVYACVDAIANEIASIEIKLFKTKPDGTVEEVTESPILDLLARANGNTTEFDLFYLTQQYLDLAGEAPWFLEFKNGEPVNIFLLRPDRLTVLPPKKDGDIIGGYKYQVYKDGVKEITLELQEVIFLKYPDPVKQFRGKGTLEAAVKPFDIDETAENFNLQFFNNAATPNSVLSTDKKLSKEVIRKLKRELESKHVGFDNAHKTLVLEGGLEWKPMALSQREMDYIETMKFTRDKILAIFRVPKSVLGLTEDVNRANAEAGDFVFAKRTVKPKMEKLIQMLNEFLVPLFDTTGDLYLDYMDPVPENKEHKLNVATEGVIKGVLTINEARELLGYDAVDGGDDVLAPVTPNVAPSKIARGLRKQKKLLANPTAMRASRKRNVVKRKMKQAKNMIVKQVQEKVSSIVYSQLLSKTESKKRMNTLRKQSKESFDGTEETKLKFQAEQLRVGDEYEKRFINKMNKIFKDQNKTIQENLAQKNNDIDKFLLDVAEETIKTAKQLGPIIGFVIGDQSRKAFRLLGQDNRLTPSSNNATAEYLEKNVIKFSNEVTIETNRIIGKVLADGVKDELSIQQISKNIRDKFKNMAGYRSDRIARSEIIRATSFATEESFVVSEVVEAKEWLTFIDERTDGACLDLNGKVIDLGKNFFKKGDTFHGVKLDYEDVAGAPLHVNCRCTLVPVVIA